ncbi:unnamed protein product [Chironomus riparius]|uniref:Lipocalin/cytosolic fatty-acid binding domain-containing protein n=1 Tax=Chironomus riparius TaxID=315576 RepID=A0A9N9WN02_9DIPT|nr:unnamed protein product [Chironomus riparius]
MELLIIFAILIKLSSCIETHFGSCPHVSPRSNITIGNISGIWYDIMKYQSIFAKGRCISFNIHDIPNNIISITVSEQNDGEIENSTRRGKVHSDGSFEFSFTFLKFSATFYILDTDYHNYIVGFGCKDVAYMVNMQMAIIWGRERELSDVYISKAYDVLKNNKISTAGLEKSEQSRCH